MTDIGGFWGAILGASGTVAILLAIAGFFGKAIVTHWLGKDFERTKAEFQKELEAYKQSFVADAARKRALVEVHKSTSLTLRATRLKILLETHALCTALPGDLAYLMSEPDEAQYKGLMRGCQRKLERLYEISFEIQLYLDDDKIPALAQYLAALREHSLKRNLDAITASLNMQKISKQFLPNIHDKIKSMVRSHELIDIS